MVRLPREARRAAIKDLQRLIVEGEGDRDAMRSLRERHGVSVATAHRWLNAAYAEWNRARRRFNRDVSLSLAIAVRRRAMRLALERVRQVAVDGELRSVPDPDLRTYLAAADSEARLLGLFERDWQGEADDFVRSAMDDFCEVLRARVNDRDLLLAIIRDLERVMDANLRRDGLAARGGNGVANASDHAKSLETTAARAVGR